MVAAGVDPNNINATRKIYIRRRPGGWRSVANDDEVAKFLEAEGFESTRPEGLALAEQIRLFVEAKVIAGMHGAGLANLLFAPHAAILELAGGYCGGGYMAMASGFGNAYASMCCPARGDDIVVDCDKLLRAIKRLSEESCCK